MPEQVFGIVTGVFKNPGCDEKGTKLHHLKCSLKIEWVILQFSLSTTKKEFLN